MKHLCMLLILLSGSSELTEEVYRDFRKGEFDFPFTGPGASKYVTAAPEGVSIKLPTGHSQLPPIGFGTRIPVRGNFEITVAYENLEVENPTSGYGAGVSLYVTMDSPNKEAASLSRQLNPKDGEIYLAHRAVSRAGSKRIHETESIVARSRTGKLRMARVGNTLYYLVAEGAGEFQPLHQMDCGTDELNFIRVAADAGGSSAAVSVRITELRIRGQASSAGGFFSRKAIIWLVLGTLACVLLVVGAILRRRSSHKRGIHVPPLEKES